MALSCSPLHLRNMFCHLSGTTERVLLRQRMSTVLQQRIGKSRCRAASTQSTAEKEDTAILDFQHAYDLRKDRVKGMGAVPRKTYQPHLLVNHPTQSHDLTLELLLASQAHLGHATNLWNPANQRFIFGARQGIHVISLDQTAAYLRRACRIITGVTRRAGMVLFVGTREGHARIVSRAAELAEGYQVFERWIPGTITNGQQILGSCELKLNDQHGNPVEDTDELLTDCPVLRPDLVVCLNPTENYVLLHECAQNAIPTIGIIDTDANPGWVTYPIPANDDSLRCVALIAGMLGRAGEEGQLLKRADLREGKILPQQEVTAFLSRNHKELSRTKDRENLVDDYTTI